MTKLDVTGKSVGDILNISSNQFEQLGQSDLRILVSRLVSASNKRIRRFEKAKQSSPALEKVYQTGGVFSTKGKNLNELRKEFIRAKQFLQSKTGSVTGWKQVRVATAKELKKKGVNVSVDDVGKMLKAYERLKERDPSVANRGLKYRTMQNISEMIDDNLDDIVVRMTKQVQKLYEEEMVQDDGVSRFFDF